MGFNRHIVIAAGTLSETWLNMVPNLSLSELDGAIWQEYARASEQFLLDADPDPNQRMGTIWETKSR